MQREQLQQLAQQLKRPEMSLNDFSDLSDQQLEWLNQQVAQLCQREEAQLQQSFIGRLPDLLSGKKSGKK